MAREIDYSMKIGDVWYLYGANDLDTGWGGFVYTLEREPEKAWHPGRIVWRCPHESHTSEADAKSCAWDEWLATDEGAEVSSAWEQTDGPSNLAFDRSRAHLYP